MKQHEKDFINAIAPYVIQNCQSHGWGVPSAIIAQAIKESVKSDSLSGLALTCFNYFGMKWNAKYGCEYKEYATKEQRLDGTYYTVYSKFCKVNSIKEGIDLYFKFIEMNPRYKRVMASTTYTEYATMLKACGWATALSYTNGIVQIVERDNLTIYDANITHSKPILDDFVVGCTYTLDANLYIRISPQGEKIDYFSITTNAQLNAYTDDEGYSVLKKGTRVTCKDIKTIDNETWLQIPSGWVCGKQGEKKYII